MTLWMTRYLTLRSVMVATFLLCLPALFSGYLGDDYFHHALLSPDVAIPKANDWSLFGLFSWIDSEPARNRALMDLGVLPWWTFEGMRYQFWRPLAEISHWLDHQLWRDHPWLMHLHSLALYLALGYALFRWFRQNRMAHQAALLALAVFMLDSTHGLTLSWLANRNALMAGLFGVICIMQYHEWRESASLRAFALSLTCLIASLLSGEIGISTTCYLGAHALLLDRQGPRKGLLALWPFALTCVIWFTLYKLGRFGADHSDVNYIDPVTAPVAFALKTLERIPVLLFSQLGLIPAEIYGFSARPIPLYLVIACLFCLGVLYVLWPLLKQSAQSRFWLLGALFSLVPVSATVPADRNLLFVGMGVSALLGQLFQQLIRQQEPQQLRRIGARILIVIHLLISPLLLPLFSYSPQLWSQLMGLPLARKIPVENSSESLLSFGIPMPVGMGALPMRFADGLPIPDKLWTISTLQQNFTLIRVDENTLLVRSDQGMVDHLETNLRNLEQFPFPEDFRIRLTDMELAITAVNEQGQPTELRLAFHNNRLASTAILSWNGKVFEHHPIPAINETITLSLANTQTVTSVTEAY